MTNLSFFQINDIEFIVPPTSISVHKEGLNYSIKSLRTKSSVKLASGNGIYHVQVNMVIPPEDFLSLHRLICQVKNNPFVYIENSFLKDSLDAEEFYESKNKHLFFTLMGINVNNHPASPGSFIVELDLRYFNTKPYIENLGYKASERDLRKVFNPKESQIYVDYSNWLQNKYLHKYFGITRTYRPGSIGLHRSGEKESIIKEIYTNSKYTEIRSRRFVSLKMDPNLSNFFRDAFKGKTEEERRRFLKEIAETDFEEKPLEGKELEKTFFEKLKEEPLEFTSDNTRIIKRTDEPTVFTKQGEYNNIDPVYKGKIEYVNIDDDSGGVNISLEITDSDYPYLFLPKDFDLANNSIGLNHKKEHYTFVPEKKGDVFIVSWNTGETKESFNWRDAESMYAGTIIRILEKGEKVFFYSGSIFEYFPALRKKFEEFKKEENLKVEAKKHYKELEVFLSGNYQRYLNRRETSGVLYESMSSISFLDYEENSLALLAGEKGRVRSEVGGVDVKLDLNTVITSVNGSLRHITPSIPILGQETPTHQFLGSMEPNYQISLIGKGSGGRMPDSFLNLEKARRDSQENAKKFSEIPDGSNFAIDSLITKLFGSYESSYLNYSETDYGTFLNEKFNFSVNSTSTFTVEGQPETYGMNIHFQETRSYKEEEIRPAFTNYSYGEKLSAEFFNAILGAGVKIPERKEIVPEKKKMVQKAQMVERREVSNDGYEWMNWKTKYITSKEWYKKPLSYTAASAARLKKQGADISVPTEKEMEKVKKYLVDKDFPGKLWEETQNSSKTAFVKTGEKELNSKNIVDPDKCAYYLCKTISTIFEYFEILFPEARGNLSIDFTSTLRINSDINYMAKRGNHKTGTAADLDLIGVNLTEAAIYIYLMQRLGYLKDYVGGRKGVFLGMGLYGSKAHKQKVKMQRGDNSWLHLDLNAVVRKYVVEDEENQFVFHVPGKWQDGLRAWSSSGYYFSNKSDAKAPNYFFGHFLNVMKSYDKIDSNYLADRLLKPHGFKTMKVYRERLEAAHLQLNGRGVVEQEKTAEEGITLVNFWNNKLKSIISEKENIDINFLELKLPENCGANITIVNEGKKHIVNLNNRDSDFRDWYPASMIKFVAAIYSAYSMIENLDYFDSNKINFKFINKAKKEVSFTYRDLVSQAIKQSENLPYSLLVAVAQKTYINKKLNEGNSSIWISYPFAFNKWTDSTRKTWAGEYTIKPNRWEGYGKIKALGRNSSAEDVEKEIDFVHGENKQPIRGRSAVGTVVDFSKLMIDFIEGTERPDSNSFYALEADQGWDREKDNVFAFVESCLLADKGHNQNLGAEDLAADLQNKLKYKIKESLKIGDTFKVYHKPGRQSVWASDCLYFKNEDEKKDSFGVTLWGEANSSAEASSRDFMTSNTFYGEAGISLTTLIGYCMSYSAELKSYINGAN